MTVEVRLAAGIKGLSALWVKNVVDQTLKREKIKGKSVSVLLTGNREIRRINRRFLNHNYATDVISFGLRALSPQLSALSQNFLGDIVVSAEMAKSVSKQLDIPFKEELARYVVHGTLHLLGYEDERKKDKILMERRQEAILSALFAKEEDPA